MKRFLALTLALTMILALAACGSKNQAPPGGTTGPETSSTTDPGAQHADRDIPNGNPESNSPLTAVVSVDYAGEELLARTEAFDQFLADESEYQVKVVFTTNTAVKDFKFLAINIEDATDHGLSFVINEVLYSTDELSPQRPLVIGTVFHGDMPTRGISYVDENGATRNYALFMSGENGSLILNEFS